MTNTKQNFNWSGEWQGHYTYSDKFASGKLDERPFVFTLYLTQDRNKIEGTCTDSTRTTIFRARDLMVVESQLNPKFDTSEYNRLLQQFPDAEVKQRLPEKSMIKGFSEENKLTFTKTYVGRTVVEWRSKGRIIGNSEIEPAVIEYSGVLNPAIAELEGGWTIYRTDKFLFWNSRTAVNAGSFEIRKYPFVRG